jgi:hypothetical protein
MVHGQSACGCIERTMRVKVRSLRQTGPLLMETKLERLIIFDGNAGSRAYSSTVLQASQWQVLNP